jgi:hypothetical protein
LGLSHADQHRVRITSHLRDHLVDFETLTRSILQRPTRIAEVVPDYPSAIGAMDAAKAGMGGVVFALGHPPPPLCGKPPSRWTSKHASSRPQTVPGTSLTVTSNRLGCWARLMLRLASLTFRS